MRVSRRQVIQAIQEFVAQQAPEIDLKQIEHLRATDVIRQSLELVEFVLHLEERLGIEININEIGEDLVVKDFGGLADELVRLGKGEAGGARS
jgi:acyl carrier protein